jgi:NitT/TauT family transport system permease protein
VRKVTQYSLVILFLLVYLFVLMRASAHPETARLPYYALSSVSRLLLTYALCLAFGLTVGIFAAMHKAAGDIIIPLLDILQSIPVLGFFPFALILILPYFGLATASLVLLFTAMAWSIVFGIIAGVKAIPQHIQDMAMIFNLRGWAYIRHIVLPSIYPPLIAGSILAFGSGWYFLIASEYITYGTTTYTLPGLGYYLNMASFQYADLWMSLAGLMTIALIVYCFHKLVWDKLDHNARESRFLGLHFGFDTSPSAPVVHRQGQHKHVHFTRRHAHQWFFNIFKFSPSTYLTLLALFLILGIGFIIASGSSLLLSPLEILKLLAYSGARIIAAYLLAVAVAILIGYLLIRKPASRNVIKPIADVLQSIPAIAYFPILFLVLSGLFSAKLTLEVASILLLVTGMLWYLLFNVLEAVEHLPKDINAVAQIYRIDGRLYVKDVLVPAMFPALVTGSILAVGGGWNAIIVAEYVNIGGTVHSITGIGSALNTVAGSQQGTATLIIMLFCMTAAVLALNHFLWRRLLNKASKYVLEED